MFYDIEVCLYFAASILVEKLKFRSEILLLHPPHPPLVNVIKSHAPSPVTVATIVAQATVSVDPVRAAVKEAQVCVRASK